MQCSTIIHVYSMPCPIQESWPRSLHLQIFSKVSQPKIIIPPVLAQYLRWFWIKKIKFLRFSNLLIFIWYLCPLKGGILKFKIYDPLNPILVTSKIQYDTCNRRNVGFNVIIHTWNTVHLNGQKLSVKGILKNRGDLTKKRTFLGVWI